MSGTTVPPNPSKTATPNIVAPREPPSSTPTGGVPTAFSQATIASAAAAAGKKKAAGIKAAMTKVEGKKSTTKKEPVTEKKEPSAEKEPVTEKESVTKKDEPVTEQKEKPAAEAVDTPKPENEPIITKKEEPVTDKDVGEEKVEALKTSVEKLKLQDKKEELVPGDEESKTPTQTPAEK